MATLGTDDQDKHVELAIALFELSFPEHRIEAALKHCNTLPEAIAWLNDVGDSASTSAAISASSASASMRLPKESRRRANKKTTDAVVPSEEPALARALIREAPSPMHPAPHERLEIRLQGDSSSHTDIPELEPDHVAVSLEPPAARSVVEPPAIGSPHVDVTPAGNEVEAGCLNIRPLQPEEASAWWAKASSLWPQLRLGKAALALKRPLEKDDDVAPGTPIKKLRGIQQSPISSDTSRGAAQGSAASRDGISSSTPHKAVVKNRSPPSSSAAKVGEFASRSAPALLSSPRTGEVSKRESETPGTSPRAQMKYNTTTEVCSICCDEFERGAAVRFGCRHGYYCTDCMVKHAEARLEVGAAHIACPECAAPIAECNLRRLLPAAIIERLLARSLEQAVLSTADLRACPTPNCPMRVALGAGELPRLQCTACKKESCLLCGAQPYHKGLTCEEFDERARARGRRKAEAIADDTFREWMQETGTKQCPQCGIPVTKENLEAQNTQYKECHKMMCRSCGAKFCFKCLKLLSDGVSCGCSNDKHGFCDPRTGKRVEHKQTSGRTPAKATKPAKNNKGKR